MVDAKRAIATAAAGLVASGGSVLLDDSTTAAQLVPHLLQKVPLTVATNFLPNLRPLAGADGISLIALGGKLVGEAMADAAAHDATVVPLCSFVATYLRGHEVAGLRIDWAAAGRDEAGNRPRADDRDAGADGGPAERGAGAAGNGSGGSGGSGV